MLALFAVTSALAADPAPPVSPAEGARLVGQARQLRNIGAACAVAGPPAIALGWALTARGAARDQDALALGGLALGAAGGLATLAGVPLLLGGGAVARHAAGPDRPASLALPVVAGGLFVGSGVLLVAGGFDGPAWPTWTAAGLYAGGAGLALVDTQRAIRRAGRPTVTLAPWLGPDGVRGFAIVVR